jgi:hypothetical protein
MVSVDSFTESGELKFEKSHFAAFGLLANRSQPFADIPGLNTDFATNVQPPQSVVISQYT